MNDRSTSSFDISILIPHHKNKELLDPLFSSLYGMDLGGKTVQFVLVDNGSSDGSVELVSQHYPDVEILSMGKNWGFAPALNRAALTVNAEWICFLNNDVRVDRLWLVNLLKGAEKTGSKCLASHILNRDGAKTQFAGGWINWFGKGFEEDTLMANEYNEWFGKNFNRNNDPKDLTLEIFFPCGGAMMIQRDLFINAGGFDDDYFMIYEDVDLGWRLRLFGHTIYLVADAYIMHDGHHSLAQESYSRKAIYYERNSLATLYKNLDDSSLSILMPLALREGIIRAKAVGGIGLPVRYSTDGFATMEGQKAFLDSLPQWKEKTSRDPTLAMC